MKRLVYGPVPSRRFGLSLGVDLLPRKTCCYDCVYCQVGKTTRLTRQREDFYPLDVVLGEVREALRQGPRPEAITLAGSGEPTLYRSLGSLIGALRDAAGLPVVLLTSGALLFDDQVARDALLTDVLAPSLDAGDAEMYGRINRPDPAIGFDAMLGGLLSVCARHPGTVRLEVMLARGINDSGESIQAIGHRLAGLRCETIDINTPVRPAPGGRVLPCTTETLLHAQAVFGPRARIIAEFRGRKAPGVEPTDAEQRILQLVARRPCTADDIHLSLGISRDEVQRILAGALRLRKIQERRSGDQIYFFASHD